jgi:hypothetical protein
MIEFGKLEQAKDKNRAILREFCKGFNVKNAINIIALTLDEVSSHHMNVEWWRFMA